MLTNVLSERLYYVWSTKLLIRSPMRHFYFPSINDCETEELVSNIDF